MTATQSSYGVSNCPIGGGVEACFLFRWSGKKGIQKFQPLLPGEYGRDPYDPDAFRNDIPIYEFQKKKLVSEWAPSGRSEVWVRIK